MSRSDPDPYGVLPDDFLEVWDADTVEEALDKAERADPVTDPAEFERCPSCTGRRLRRKRRKLPMEHRREGEYKCSTCHEHFDDPLPAPEDFDAEDPVCPSCGSARLRLPAHIDGVRCLECETDHATAKDAAEDDGRDETNETDETPIMPRTLKATAETYCYPSGDDLREMRKALSLSKREVGLAASSTIRSWEVGETRPRLDRLEELVEYYRLVDAARRAARVEDLLEGATEGDEGDHGTEETADPFAWVAGDDLAEPEARREGLTEAVHEENAAVAGGES